MKRMYVLLLFCAWISFAHAQNVVIRGQTQEVCVTPTADTSAYAAGDLIGDELTVTDAFRALENSAILVNVTVVDQAAQSSGLTLWICTATLGNSTLTDQAALDINDADIGNCKPIALSTYKDTASNSVSMNEMVVGFAGSSSQTDLYAVIESEGTPTYAAADDLTLCLTFLQD